ncbi:hypothetical protein AVEN_217359-1 [Araneus ventricosus]|uniref:Uncharacterized protein n=1 Tax=Araneus ventricosus TaxID=182803 RepID=A0A4Y2S3E6_ARAVE|nr:hypothetical protein AVEN_217359-1 [Araneus ventricosus]
MTRRTDTYLVDVSARSAGDGDALPVLHGDRQGSDVLVLQEAAEPARDRIPPPNVVVEPRPAEVCADLHAFLKNTKVSIRRNRFRLKMSYIDFLYSLEKYQ